MAVASVPPVRLVGLVLGPVPQRLRLVGHGSFVVVASWTTPVAVPSCGVPGLDRQLDGVVADHAGSVTIHL